MKSPRKAYCKPNVDANPYKWVLGYLCLVFNLISGLTTGRELGTDGRLILKQGLILIPINGSLVVEACLSL